MSATPLSTAPMPPAPEQTPGRDAQIGGTRYIRGMIIFLTILVGLSMAATLGVLFAGMLGVARRSGDGERSNRLMRWRIIMQAVTIVLFLLLLSVARS
jgi:heme/copper-type cytochrome/quinol oxidase subunit 1